MPSFSPATCLRRSLAALTLLAVAGCGGGDFAELFVKLVTARFVPAQATLAPGAHLQVDLEVTCDRAGLDTQFGRLGVRAKLDPSLAGGITAAFFGSADAQGFHIFPCNGTTGDPDLRIAHLPVTITVAAGTAPLSTTLNAYIEVEPLGDEPSKDSATAHLALTISEVTVPTTPVPGPSGDLLINGAFDDSVGVGGLPTAPGNWRGDPSRVVGAEQDIAPRSAPTMLRFDGSASIPGASSFSSRQWQVVDLAPFHDAIASGIVSARLAAFFNRIGGETVDQRFDLSLYAYDGAMADLPTRNAAGTHLAMQAATLTADAYQWQEAAAVLALPAAATYLLVEIRAVEAFSETAEFAGNYVDDASLTLSAMPSAGTRP